MTDQSVIEYEKTQFQNELNKYLEKTNTTHFIKRVKESHINIDSRNRATKYTFQYFSATTLSSNPIRFTGTNTIRIYHPNNNLDVNKAYDVIITGVIGDTVNGVVQTTTCGYPLNLINFDEDNPVNIYTIVNYPNIETVSSYYTIDNILTTSKSDYYDVELKNILSQGSSIKTGDVGGSNVNIKIIKNRNAVYNDPNHYKINLGRIYKNVLAIRLVSTEIPNTSYTININSSDKQRNNKFTWINEDEKVTITDKVVTSDHVFLNSVDPINYINSEHLNSNPGRGSDNDGAYTLTDLGSININDSPTTNQILHATAVINAINNDSDQQNSYCLLTNTIDTDQTIANPTLGTAFQTPDDIYALYQRNKYYTPKKMFDSNFFLENNYHCFGKTLVAHIEYLISLKTEPVVQKLLPWEYNYFTTYNSRGRERIFGTNVPWEKTSGNDYPIDNTNSLKYLGYQVFDALLENKLGYSDTKFQSTSTLTTEITSVKNIVIPKNIILGTEMIPQDPRDVTGISTTLEQNIYPIHNLFLDEGIYKTEQLMDIISDKLNTDTILNFDWSIRDWKKNLTTSNKYIMHQNNRKRIFEIEYDRANNILEFRQFKSVPYQHSISDKIINEKNEKGKPGLYLIVNEGYPYVCIVNKGHLFKNGSIVKLEGSGSVFNINASYINRLQPIIVNPVYKLHLRLIFPLPSETYFRVSNPNIDSDIAANLEVHQINSSNKATTYDVNNPDSIYKILIEIYGEDTLNMLNKGTVDNMLNYVGSKLSQNLQDQNTSYVPLATSQYTKFQNHITESAETTTHNPENPFKLNEIFIKYKDAVGESEKLTMGRITNLENYTDDLGNIVIHFELLTNNVNNFTIGDIIVGTESDVTAMIVPYYWHQSRFPTKAEIDAGYREYLISQSNFNTVIPNFYWSATGIKNKSDDIFDKKWYLEPVHNGEISYSVDVNIVPTDSNIEGIENKELEVLTPVKFALLFGLDNTVGNQLGFESNKEGIIAPTISSTKININFKPSISNTVKQNEITIQSTKFVKLYDNQLSNFLLVTCYDKIPYKEGDKVYFENHSINKYLEKQYLAEELLIKQIYPLKDWFYILEARYIQYINSMIQFNLATNPMSVDNGSNIVTITHVNHGLEVGDKVTITGSGDVLASYVEAADVNITTSITRIVSANSYTILPPSVTSTPNTDATGGGSNVKVKMNYTDVTLGTDPFSITNGSQIITVTHASHGLLAGDIIYISGAENVLVSYVVAADLNKCTPITSVVDANSYTITPILTATPNSTTTGGGSSVIIKHNAAAGAIQRKITNMKQWFYQNINNWTNYNIDYRNYIIENYLYPRVLHGSTQTIIHVSKILVKETTGDRLSSAVFLPGMTITHNAAIIGLKVLGITKIKHYTDNIYNEEPITKISDITNNSYYYIYFQRLSTVSLTDLDAVSLNVVSYTDGSGSTNLRNASATLVTIPGQSTVYMNDVGADYLYYFYLANKTILEYKTSATNDENYYIGSNNINIDDSKLRINPFAGREYGTNNNVFPYIAYLNTDPNNSDEEYGSSGAEDGPFYVVNGDNRIKVIHPKHGLYTGDEITITGATDVIVSRVTAADLNVTTPITYVISRDAYYIEPTLTATPNSTTYGGSSAVKIESYPKSVDVNINAIPITTLNSGDNVYITNHQKPVPKYYEEDDILEADEIFMNRLKSSYYDGKTDAVVSNINPNQLTGIKNGVYRSLVNLWPGSKSNQYYASRYLPGKTILTDIEWSDSVSKGFLNQGGKIRVKKAPYQIIGNNDYVQSITNELKKDSVNDDLTFELYSVLKTAVTDTYTTEVTSIVVKHGVNFRVGGLIIIDPIIYSQHTESTPDHTEQNTVTELNYITAIAGPDEENDNAYTLTLQFRILNDHLANAFVIQKGYVSTSKAESAAGTSTITVNDPDYFVVDDIINIGFNSFNSNLTEGDVSYYIEQRNRVLSKAGAVLTLQNELIQTYASGTYIIKMAPTIIDNNHIKHNFLATQNVLIRGEWYTKIFYQGPNVIENITVKDGEYGEGANAFNKYTQKEVYISGMKGMSIPNISFDNYASYVTDRATLNSVTTKTSYNIAQITPVPDGFHKLYPNIEQDNTPYLLTDSYNIPIKGGFYSLNKTPYQIENYWRDTGIARQTTLSSSSSSLQIGTTATFGTEIDAGENNENQFIQAPTPTNNERFGHKVKISGNYLAVGTDKDQNGSVYIYYKNQATGVYAHQKTIAIPSDIEDTDSRFGSFLDISDNYLAIGAPWYPSGSSGGSYIDYGRAYLYKRAGTNWELIKTFIPTDAPLNITTQQAMFGHDISLDGDFLVIGSQEANVSFDGSGKAYIYEKNYGGTDNWGHIKTLAYPGSNEDSVDDNFNERFGVSISIDNNYLIVGASQARGYDTQIRGSSGLAFIYYKHQGGRDQWGKQATLNAQLTNGTEDINANDFFGLNVSIKGRYAYVGSQNNDNGGDANAGSAYIYYRTGTQWVIQQKIVPSTRIADDKFGSAGEFSPNTNYICVSASFGNKVYIFQRSGTSWTELLYVENSDANKVTNDRFGFSSAYDGFNILVGANGYNQSNNDASKGSIYIFNQTNTQTDGNGVITVDDHSTHSLYIDGIKQQMSIDYSYTNNTTLATTSSVVTNSVVEHSIYGWRKIYETGRYFNCVLIKGKYLGYGGQIEFRDKDNVLDNPNGFTVKQVVYTNDNPLTPSNQFFIDLEKKHTDFISSNENNRIVSSGTLYKNLTLLESNNLFSNNHSIGTGGSVYQKVRDAPVNDEDNFMNMCIVGLDTIENTSTNTIDDIFAKILLPSGNGSIYYDTFVATPKFFYDRPLRELSELEIKFLDSNGNLIKFNGFNHSFTVEIIELEQDLLTYNTSSGQIS